MPEQGQNLTLAAIKEIERIVAEEFRGEEVRFILVLPYTPPLHLNPGKTAKPGRKPHRGTKVDIHVLGKRLAQYDTRHARGSCTRDRKDEAMSKALCKACGSLVRLTKKRICNHQHVKYRKENPGLIADFTWCWIARTGHIPDQFHFAGVLGLA